MSTFPKTSKGKRAKRPSLYRLNGEEKYGDFVDYNPSIEMKIIAHAMLLLRNIKAASKSKEELYYLKDRSWLLSDKAANFIKPEYGSRTHYICESIRLYIEALYLYLYPCERVTYTHVDALKNAKVHLGFAQKLL